MHKFIDPKHELLFLSTGMQIVNVNQNFGPFQQPYFFGNKVVSSSITETVLMYCKTKKDGTYSNPCLRSARVPLTITSLHLLL